MPQFEIEHYTIKTDLSASRNGRRRHIDLVSVDLSHGIRNRVNLIFVDNYRAQTDRNPFQDSVGQVSNVRPSNFDGMRFIAFVLFDMFEEYYDILRSESPVYFNYRLGKGEDDANIRFLDAVGIWTGLEPTGEGFTDLSEFLPDARSSG